MKTRYIGLRVFIITVTAVLMGCTDKKHDYNNVDSSVHLFENGMILNVGNTSPISLSSLLDSAGIEFLHNDSIGNYYILLEDSLERIDLGENIPDMNLDFEPKDIDPFVVNFKDNVEFPTFKMSETKRINLLNMDIDVLTGLEVIDNQVAMDISVDLPAVTNPLPSSVALPTMAFTEPTDGNEFEIKVKRSLPIEVNRIMSADFNGVSYVEVVIDKSTLNLPSGITATHMLRNLRLKCPVGVYLSIANEGIIENGGRDFVVSNYELTNDISTFRVMLDSAQFPSSASTTGWFEHTIEFECEYDYELDIEVAGGTNIAASNYTIGLSVGTSSGIEDLLVETNDVYIENIMDSATISEDVDISGAEEVTEVRSVTFGQPYPSISLDLPEVELGGLELTDGTIKVEIPKMFIYDMTQGNADMIQTDAEGNKYFTLEYNELGRSLDFFVQGAIIDVPIIEDEKGRYMPISARYEFNAPDIVVGAGIASAKELKENATKYFIEYNLGFDLFTIVSSDVSISGLLEKFEEQSYVMDISETIDPMLEKIWRVDFTDILEGKFKVHGTGLIGFDSLYLQDFSVSIPKFLNITTTEGVVNDNNEILIKNKKIELVNGEFDFEVELDVLNIDFEDGHTLDNGVLNLNEEIKLNGKVFVPGADLEVGDINEITLTPTIDLNAVSVSKVEAQINLDAMDIDLSSNIEVPLEDAILEAIKNLDLMDPTIELRVKNTTLMSLDCNIKLRGHYIDGSLGELSRQVRIEATEEAGVEKETVIVIRNDENKDLSDFLKRIPQNIDVEVDPILIGERQVIDLVEDNIIDIGYEINIPLSFGEDLDIAYDLEFDGLTDVLNEVFAVTNEFALFIDAKNTIPLDLDVFVTPMNIAGEDISEVLEIGIDKVIAGGTTDNPSLTKIILSIKEAKEGGIDELESIKLSLRANANSTIGGATLSEDQYLKVALKLNLPEGVTLDLGNE